MESVRTEFSGAPCGAPSPTRRAKGESQLSFKSKLDHDKYTLKIEVTRRPVQRAELDTYNTSLLIGDGRTAAEVKQQRLDNQINYRADIANAKALTTNNTKASVSRRPVTPEEQSLLMANFDAKTKVDMQRKQEQMRQVQEMIQNDMKMAKDSRKGTKEQYSGFIIGQSNDQIMADKHAARASYKEKLDYDCHRDAGNNMHKLDNDDKSHFATRKTNVSLTEPEVNSSGLTGILIGTNNESNEQAMEKKARYKAQLDRDLRHKN